MPGGCLRDISHFSPEIQQFRRISASEAVRRATRSFVDIELGQDLPAVLFWFSL